MSEGKKRRVHTAEFKAKVGLEAGRGVKTVTEIAQEYGVHPVLVGQWKKEFWKTLARCSTSSAARSPLMKAAPRTSCMARSGG